ncbi:MAG: hypothetical protein AB1601_11815 [Planctomycetota bacterium]
MIYAVFTLWMAAAAFQNATAARRSAEAMEASVEEQRQSRWAAFAAVVSFPDGHKYWVHPDENATIILGNLFRQPILQLRVGLWEMDAQSAGEGQVKYSTMMESEPKDVPADGQTVRVQLRRTLLPESERVRLGNLALGRYREVFSNAVPRSALCLISYMHRAQLSPSVSVFDLQCDRLPT